MTSAWKTDARVADAQTFQEDFDEFTKKNPEAAKQFIKMFEAHYGSVGWKVLCRIAFLGWGADEAFR